MDQVDFVCISLINRDDRRQRVKEIFTELGIVDRINWWYVEKHPRSGILGCFESHYHVWSSSEFKRPYLCVFEDDILINIEDIDLFYDIIEKLDRIYQQGEEMVILNMDPQFFYKTGPSKHPQVNYGYGANCSAYICPRHYLPLVINHVTPKFGIPIDIALYGLSMGLVFLFYQSRIDSDISPELLQIFNPVPKTTYDLLIKSKTFGRALAYFVHQYCIHRVVDGPIVDRRHI